MASIRWTEFCRWEQRPVRTCSGHPYSSKDARRPARHLAAERTQIKHKALPIDPELFAVMDQRMEAMGKLAGTVGLQNRHQGFAEIRFGQPQNLVDRHGRAVGGRAI